MLQGKQQIDGATFWNPYEGLGVAADLLKVAHSWVKDGHLQDARTPDKDACARLQDLEGRTRALRPIVKAAMEEWHKAHKKRCPAYPIALQQSHCEVLAGLRLQVEQIQATIANSGGKLALRNQSLVFPRAEVRFDTSSYFEFVYRSVDELLLLAKDGHLAGPTPAQSW